MDSRKIMLIVDDIPMNRAILREIFQNDYDIIEAENGIAALGVLRSRSISVVILDLVMPQMDGFELLRVLQADRSLHEIPIVVVTQLDDSESEIKALNLGASDCITKPYDGRVVRQRVQNIVSKCEVITAKAEVERLRSSMRAQRQLSAVLDNMVGGVVLYEIRPGMPRVVYRNTGYYALFGCDESDYTETYGTQLLSEAAPQEREALHRAFQDACRETGTVMHEYRAQKKDGTLLWLRMQASRIFYGDGKQRVLLATYMDITQLKSNQDALRQRAEYDVLTEIYNKDTFYEKAQLKIAQGKADLMICLDLQHFKVINDLYGTEQGNRVLQYIAGRIAGYAQKNEDMVCGRIGDDSFGICMTGDDAQMQALTQQIDKDLESYPLDFDIRATYGVYRIEDRSLPAGRMCDRAQLARATVQGNYLDRCAVFTDQMRLSVVEEQQVVSDMEEALTHHQFEVYLQPICSVSKGAPISMEALVRWRHPEKGLVPPDRFIPVFERNGFITKVDSYVWEEVCRLLRSRLDAGKPVVPISVNVSRLNLRSGHLAQDLIGLVRRYHLSPNLLKLEITESAFAENRNQLLDTMKTLQQHGFAVLMDDFGSGYSSLNMLKDVPVDLLKVDMRFLEGFETSDRAGNILTAIVRMAKWLRLPVIAEGVETQEQVAYLQSIGCDQMQGYYFSRPRPAAEFDAILTESIPHASGTALHFVPGQFETMLRSGATDTVFNSVAGGMGIYELNDGKLEAIRVNDEYYRIMGYDPDAFYKQGQDILQAVLPEDRSRLLLKCSEAISQGSARITLRRWHRTGRVLTLMVKIKYLGGDENHAMFNCAISDVTEQQRAKRETLLEKYMAQLCVTYLRLGLWDLETGRGCRIYNDGQRQPMLDEGWLQDETGWELLKDRLHKIAEELILPEDRKTFEQTFYLEPMQRYFKTHDAPLTEKLRMRTEDGSIRWMSLSVLRIPNEERSLYLSSLRDIDNEKKVQETLEENERLQREYVAAERYRVIAEQTGTAVFEYNNVTGVFYSSVGFKKFALSKKSRKKSCTLQKALEIFTPMMPIGCNSFLRMWQRATPQWARSCA